MRLPLPLIVLLVDLVMRSMNRKMGSRVPPVRRKKALPEPVRRAAFDRLWQQTLAGAPNPLIDYNLPFPRMEFLNYLCDHLGLAAHGSQLPDLQMLKPVRNSSDATEFGNRQQIFATADAIYAAWFAVWDRPKTQGTHNACMRIGPAAGQWVRLYYFHLINVEAGCTFPYTSGTIYLARGEDFPHHDVNPQYARIGMEAEQWGSTDPVQPLARIRVAPQDFPYLDRVEFIRFEGR